MEERVDMKADFAAAFREQVAGWLRQMGPLQPGEKVRTIPMGARRLLITEELVCPPNQALADILVVLGDLHAGPGCWFAGPVLVGGTCLVGPGSRVMALAAGKSLTLGENCAVSDWVDCHGPLALGGGSRVHGAASRHSIQVGKGVEAAGLFAPAVSTPGFAPGAALPEMRERPVEIRPPGAQDQTDWSVFAGLQKSRLSALGKNTWIYDGSLKLDKPVILKSKLVTRGSLYCAAASLLDGDIRAGGDVNIGADSIVNGSVTARGDVTLEANCLFSGDLSGGVTVTLGAGARGYRDGGPVILTSGAAMHLEGNVLVRGELRSGAGIRQRSAAGARKSHLVLANA